ncbi:hypothetical protein K439DRAFT_680958 [Ramaria rubella]|nr:hypothetical protein K439DRAFT_680958 [Ramaria rubella]
MFQPPPPYNGGVSTSNPDTRPLPAGWVTQYDKDYKAWFYVNTRDIPPRSVWVHPLGPPPPLVATGYAPPPGPPAMRLPSVDPYGRSPSPYGCPPMGCGGPQPSAYGNTGEYDYPQQGYAPSPQPGCGPPPQQWGPPPQQYGGVTPYASYSPQQYVQPPPPQSNKLFGGGTINSLESKQSAGVSTALLAGGGGLLGGALLAHAFAGDGRDGGDGGD